LKLDAIHEQYAKLFRDIDDFSKKTNGKGLDRRPHDPASHASISGASQREILKLRDAGNAEGRINDLEKSAEGGSTRSPMKLLAAILKPEDGLVSRTP
jgi:hypothetical protein